MIKEEGTLVQTYENVISTLIFVITKHFTEDLVYFQKRTSKILNNLKFPILQDMFLVKVMTRLDCGSYY